MPGFLFLELTEPRRRPRQRSALGELLLVLSVGIPTTGISLLAVALIYPTSIARFVDTWAAPTRSGAASNIRFSVLVIVVIVVLASSIAWLLSYVISRRTTRRFVTHVRAGVLSENEAPKDTRPFVRVELLSGAAVSGYLHGFEYAGDGEVALMKPIYRWAPDQSRVKLPIDKVLISGEEIRLIQVKYMPRKDGGKQPPQG